jgi:hypothetical protein
MLKLLVEGPTPLAFYDLCDGLAKQLQHSASAAQAPAGWRSQPFMHTTCDRAKTSASPLVKACCAVLCCAVLCCAVLSCAAAGYMYPAKEQQRMVAQVRAWEVRQHGASAELYMLAVGTTSRHLCFAVLVPLDPVKGPSHDWPTPGKLHCHHHPSLPASRPPPPSV